MKPLTPILILAMLAGSVRGAPITGFRVGINWTGFDNTGQPGSGTTGTPFTYEPLDGTLGQFKSDYVNAVVQYIAPKVGRDMDLKQLVTNRFVNWSDMTGLTTDYSVNGIRETTSINIANQMVARVHDFIPQVGMPLESTTDYAKQQGKLWAQQYRGKTININLGNEVWNVFAGNLGDWNLQQAHAEGYQGDDFRILGLRQGVRLAQHAQAFMQGFAEGGGDPSKVNTIIEGFAPVPQYIQNQIDGMNSVGIAPKSIHSRLSIAQYAAGSATDLTGPLGTSAQKRDSILSFIQNGPVQWTQQTKSLAIANGLPGVVDAYEMRLGGKPVNGSAETADWVAFQNSDEEQQVQDQGIRALVTAAGGIGSILNVEGYGGFPMSAPQGQFPLVDINQMFSNPLASGALRGVDGVIDFASVPSAPEPTSVFAAVACLVLMGRRRAA